MKIQSLDHLVLTVKDIETTCRFYEQNLGMQRRVFQDNRTALHFGKQKINLHAADNPIDPNVRHALPGSADLCFVAEDSIETIAKHLKALGTEIIEGPCQRTGAQGPINSVYFYDPDENLIEVASYS